MFDLIADLCFILDIFLSFLAVEEDVNGELIIDRKTIAIRYLKGWFTIDMISSFPVAWIMFYL